MTAPLAARADLAGPAEGENAAGFVTRFIAMAIDLAAIVAMIVAASAFGSAAELILPSWSWLATAVPAAVVAVSSVAPFLYFFVLLAVTGRTAGKAVMGIRVEAADGGALSVTRSLLRTLAYVISLLPVGAGFAWVLFDPRRKAWHDHLVGSRVVYAPGVRRFG